jgi:protoporphyrin/coproporphyrin ferrochelatase
MTKPAYDAILLLSFGGPEQPEDVMPFLENVTRGRRIPRERLEEVARGYLAFGGKSPINDQCRELIAVLQPLVPLPIYWGNRNWHPYVADALREMAAAGVRRAIVLATSAWSSYSGCRQYLEDIERARAEVGESAPVCDKIPPFCSEDGFIEAMADRVRTALAEFGGEPAELLFTAHSIPLSMSTTSQYVEQLKEACRRTAELAGHPEHSLAYQSRSGAPSQPWLEPDIRDALATVSVRNVVVAPIGFLSDHMEVKVDLDTQARARAEELGLRFVRAGTVGTHPRFVRMLRELIEDQMRRGEPSRVCPADCCPPPHPPGR